MICVCDPVSTKSYRSNIASLCILVGNRSLNVQRPPPPLRAQQTLVIPWALYGGEAKGGGGVMQKKPKMEQDGDKRMKKGWVVIVMVVFAGSNADGAVAVSFKFHLEHPRTCFARLDRGLSLMRVRELRRRRRPEDDRPIRAGPIPGRNFRRHRVRHRMDTRSCLFRADTAADTDDDKRELRPRETKNNDKLI